MRTALDRAAVKVEGKFPTKPLVEASIRHTLGKTYGDLGLYIEAERHLRRAIELLRRFAGENHDNTLAAMFNLGRVDFYMANYPEAERLIS